ncbi:MAG: hypothetical protein KJO85_05100 [Gammaproteobacteria bacterium]|nr:hypothetical protein [Gammaproteobacteria bacterium]
MIVEIFRGLIVTSTVLYIAYYILPFVDSDFLSEQSLIVLSWARHGALVPFPVWLDYSMFVIWIGSAVGMYFFVPLARSVFVWIYIVLTALTPFFGLNVETGLSQMLFNLVTLFDGAIIAMAYLTSVERNFVAAS